MKKLHIFLLMIAVAAPSFAQKQLSKSFTGIKRIRISASAGDCVLKKSTDATVKVNLTHSYDDSFEPTIDQQGDRLVIKEQMHSHHNSGSSTWTLEVPDNIEITFATGSGNMEANDLSLNIQMTTGSGDLFLNNVKGDVRGTTGSGNVEISGFSGELSATSGSGSIKIASSQASLSVTCGSGNIRLTDSQGSFKATTGSGEINARNLTIKESSKFATGSGSAEIVLAASPTADLSVASGSGDAVVNFNGNAIDGTIVMRASKKNGNIVAPFNFDKTEEVGGSGDYVTIEKTVKKGQGTNRISISTGSGDAVIKK